MPQNQLDQLAAAIGAEYLPNRVDYSLDDLLTGIANLKRDLPHVRQLQAQIATLQAEVTLKENLLKACNGGILMRASKYLLKASKELAELQDLLTPPQESD